MNLSQNKYEPIENLIFNVGLRIESVETSPSLDKIFIHLTNDILIVAAIVLFKGLKNANANELLDFKFLGNGTGIHWPELDEDLSLKGFLKEYFRKVVMNKRELVIS